MKNIQTMTRLLTLGLSAVALAACGDDGGTPTTSGATEGATESDSDTAPTTGGPTTQTTQTSQTTTVPTEGSMSDSESDSDGTTANVTITESESESESESETETGDPVCGNGIVEGNEECDDGNDIPGDGCEPGCVNTPVCGNEIVESGETCDDGNTEPGDGCDENCQVEQSEGECGNGIVERPELCDDGNDIDGDGCESDCTFTPPICGNGIVEQGEQCDDGNDIDGGPNDFCKNDCTPFIPPTCAAPPDYVVCDADINLSDKADKTNAHKSMGICNDQPDNSVIITDYSFNSNNNAAWQVAKGFGTYMFDHDNDPDTPDQLLYSPREGDTFLMISTGIINAPNAQGIVTHANNSQGGNGNNNNDDSNNLPPPFRYERGSNNGAGGTPFQNCDGAPEFRDCSDSLQAQWLLGNSNPDDKLWFTFKTTVPDGTFGYTFNFAYCSSEWPTYVDTAFNDLLIVYQVDPTEDNPDADPPVDAYSGNVTFIPDPNNPDNGLPLTITALDPYLSGPGYSGNEPQLAGTGFETRACSDWFEAKGGVQPGAEITIGFFIADMGDSILATLAMIDNFRWDCEGCIPSEVNDCGVVVPM